MKVLIWIGCLILNFIIQVVKNVIIIALIPITDDVSRILAELLSYTLWAAIVCFCVWLAIKLCKKWDWYEIMKKATEAGMSVSEYGRQGLSEKFLVKLDSLFKSVHVLRVKPLLKELRKQKKITRDQYIIFLNEYYDKK